jgi:hypothetical protein
MSQLRKGGLEIEVGCILCDHDHCDDYCFFTVAENENKS